MSPPCSRALEADKKYDLAVEQYRIAADIGYAHAMGALARSYKWGLGVTRDYGLAKSWTPNRGSIERPSVTVAR